MSYVELRACSAFSFLRGASFPEQLAEHAAELELPAVALLDRNGVYGSQRFSVAGREHGVRAIVGSDLTMEDGALQPVLVENRTGYENLCSLLTEAHLRSEKGSCAVRYAELEKFSAGLIALFSEGMSQQTPGSARVSRAGDGVSPSRTFRGNRAKRKVRRAGTARPARETRARSSLQIACDGCSKFLAANGSTSSSNAIS